MNGSRDIIPFGVDEKKAIDDDGWDNVSISSTESIEAANCSQRLRGFFLRLFLSLLVIGACAGALIWSFVNGEAGIYVHERNASVNFSIFVDEYSVKEGTYSLTFRTPDSSNGGLQTPKIYPSFWYQDNTNSRLVHQSCDFDASTNYLSYIDRLGLTRLKRHHSAIEETHHHKEVFVYDGDPDSVVLQGSNQTSFLVTAYADAGNGWCCVHVPLESS
ncbi:hypothetical protein ANCDUO_11903 [Ancylostoma duodenale]|uniref:Uncharacterized protein n=1 Tax=Ancylostoma duodenale TaxID=51022 RepID=A0A0C2GAA8_9BILA|nr:hypothetical protein ANCDUO_11903 [Ancylostoma duodenale]